MAEQISQIKPRERRVILPDAWSLGALVIALAVLLPIGSVVWLAFFPEENIWPHLLRTTLPRYLENTLVLALAVAALAAVTGTVTAWMVTMYRFPGSRWLQWMLLLPLAIPAYVAAYALVDFLEYAGPVQGFLRSVFGWHSARDYWFPEIRSRGAAVIVLAGALYPYVYLLARAAFREQAAGTYEIARALGAGPVRLFFKVGLPLARPAIAAGLAIVMMETVSDYGVVSYFSVQTLTTAIFTTWLEGGNAGGAAQIAGVVLLVVFLLVGLEKRSRKRLRYFHTARMTRRVLPLPLAGWRGWLATAVMSVPFAIGFLLPTGVIIYHAMHSAAAWLDPGLTAALVNTIVVGGIASVVTVLAALFMVYGVRMTGRRLPALLLPLTTIGYAAPGAVLGVGLLFPMARFDQWLADWVQAMTGHDVGLLMTGTAFAIGYAYVVRFFAIAQGATDTAMGRVPPSLPMAARTLGRSPGATLREIYVPLIRGSVGTALLLVFVDCVKELPATLLLRPFNYNTLATRVYEKASLEQIANAAPAALLVMAVGLAAVVLIINGEHRRQR